MSNRLLILILFLIFCPTCVFSGPFSTYTTPPSEVESTKSVKPRHVLCGITKKWEGDYLCVDGVWLTISQFEHKFKSRVRKIDDLGVLVNGGKKIMIGSPVLTGAQQMEAK
jgi:hypothetical protein